MMYVRVKRRNQTIFLHVEPQDNFMVLKQKCAEINNVPPSSVLLIEGETKRELADLASVSDSEIENDAVLFLVLKKESGAWEQVDLVPFEGISGEAEETRNTAQ
eukprot:CAMPEP_0185763188 /NCGR_PEP_ID=MMETSP1174-20130828/22145_1 /TAXON_ID=35687 /ORGANISM="Dictyocha speculum, Strain CCMP1381" /LENGTH=103 /DNA_ID=CAMNT_0028445199 /DNA_START=13 /DNA_END=324 /DNA_ORIENTATION=-